MKKTFTLIFSFVICALAQSNLANAASQQQMRFHCQNDTTEINQLLADGSKSGLKKPNELMTFYAHKLIGRPYVAHTLEGDTEKLTINIDQLDCTTFVEALYALTRTTLNMRESWRDFANQLESVRYHRGVLGDYSSRLHYISDWIIDNNSRGNLVEVTADLPRVAYKVKTIDYMTTPRDQYPQLADSAIFEKVREFERGFCNHRFPYIKKEVLDAKDVVDGLESGDIVAITTKTPGLDVSHLGIIEKNGKTLFLLDASSIGKKVQLETLDLKEMLRMRKSAYGIRVFRIQTDN